MAASGAAKRYAQAAFELAKAQGTLDVWERDLGRLLAAMQNPTVHEFFDNPAIPDDAKRQAIGTLLPADADTYVRNLALLMLERGRLELLPAAVETFHDLVLEDRGIAIANITTAIELQPDELQQVVAQLGQIVGKEISPRTFVDPSIIGGVLVHVGDTLIDGSVRTQLVRLREQMVH
jgi:F-type H+-transporting ATPase subunit delta